MDEFAGQDFDYVLAVCDAAKQACPVFPGKTHLMHWSIKDPAGAPGTKEERKAVFRKTRDELAQRIQSFVQEAE